jgi:hypothetical protein
MAGSTISETWKRHWDIVDRAFKFLGWTFALATVSTLWWKTRAEPLVWLSVGMLLLLLWLVISPFWLAARGRSTRERIVDRSVAVLFLVGGAVSIFISYLAIDAIVNAVVSAARTACK